MGKDLRSFLADAEKSDKLYRITREVNPAEHMGVLADESDKALLVENVTGFEGWRIAANFNQNRDMEMVGMGVDSREDVIKKLAACIDEGPKPLKMVDKGPCQETIWDGEDANLNKLPIAIHSELDGGKYIGSGVGVVVDPDTGHHNTTWPRIQVGDGKTCGFLIYSRHVSEICAKYHSKGAAMPMSVSIGHHPAIDITASLSIHHPDCGELAYASSVAGEDMEFVMCANGVPATAHAEVVIEGEVPAGVLQDEGPFGNYMGTYAAGPMARDGVQKALVFKINRITMRRNPVYRHLNSTVWTEHQRLCMLPMEAKLYTAIKEMGMLVHDIHIPSWGGCGLTIIQMTPRGPGEAEQAMLKATMWEDTTLGFMSHTVVAVNRDVNIYDARDVMWAISVRTDWGQPIQQIFNTPASPLRAGAERVKGLPYRLSGKAMINASVLPPQDDFVWWDINRAWPKGHGSFRLEDFVDNYYPSEPGKVRNVSHEEMVAIKPGKYKPEVG